jgi:putative NADH-flavin reductase
MRKVLIAGATGYLGKYIAMELLERRFNTTVLIRNSSKFESFGIAVNKILKAEITNKTTIKVRLKKE